MTAWGQQLFDLLDGFPDVIFSMDPNGRFTYLSPQAEALFGCSVASLLGKPLWAYVAGKDRDEATSILALESDSVFNGHVNIVDSMGGVKNVRLRCKPHRDGSDKLLGFQGLLLECHSRENLEQKLRQSQKALKDQKKSIRELNEHVAEGEKYRAIANHIAEIAHELKQPLVIIGGFARRMATKLGAWEKLDPDTQPECFTIISKELKRLEEMLSGLMGIVRQDKLHLESVDPNELIEEVVRINEERLKERRVTVETDLDREMGGVPLDPHLFEHVIRNLVANAIEASPPDGTISIQTEVSKADPRWQQDGKGQAPAHFEMRIANGGNPIPFEELENIFRPFYTTKPHGTGVGLTLSQHIVEQHHGSIDVRSGSGGTVFTVRIPLTRVKESAIHAPEIEATSPHTWDEGKSRPGLTEY